MQDILRGPKSEKHEIWTRRHSKPSQYPKLGKALGAMCARRYRAKPKLKMKNKAQR